MQTLMRVHHTHYVSAESSPILGLSAHASSVSELGTTT